MASTIWKRVPNEVVLIIIEHLPFDAGTFRALHLVDRHLQSVITTYEYSVTLSIAQTQYPDALTIYLASSPLRITRPAFHWLSELHNRSNTIATILGLVASTSLQIVLPQPQAPWIRLITAALHICYRLQDCSSSSERAALICSLPLNSLAVVYITLLFVSRAAQQIRNSIMHPDSAPAREEQLMEICLCFEQCCLQHGPEFIRGILVPSYHGDCNRCHQKPDANEMLLEEWNTMNETRVSMTDGQPPQQTLISCFKERFMEKGNCARHEMYSTAWKVTQGKGLLGGSSSVVTLALDPGH